jgi:conjugative transfer signal peptidase TraF
LAAIAIGVFQLCGALGLRFNLSNSLPIGIYVVSDASAKLIEFCPDQNVGTLTLQRGYRREGVCRDGGAPLLKPVVAEPGDSVDLAAEGIRVNGKLLRNTKPLRYDTKCRPLPAWLLGHYIVAQGTIWVASSYNPRSFDSRYFGPIRILSIQSHVRALLTGG